MEQQQQQPSLIQGKEPILVGYGYFATIVTQDLLKRVPKASKFVVITDTNLHSLYSPLLTEAFSTERLGAGKQGFFKVIEPGELSKSRGTKEMIEDWMFERGCNRDTCVVAFGGGVIGDLSGYVASTYMRGVPFIQVPTTLLAMVDSSIGGKTGVNTPAGKNLVGSFYHPQAVYIDLAFLRTLPQREFCNGMAEVIKTAAIADVDLFETLERNVDAILNQKEPHMLKDIVLRSAAIKAKVVMEDAREDGIRCILNYGHTIGHAIEALMAPKMLHGECVAIGMIVEAQISNKMGHLFDSSIIGRLECCLQEYNLPITIPKNLNPNDLLKKMAIDKKNAKGKIRSVILKSIGDVFHYPVEVDKEIIRQLLLPFISVIPTVINGNITVPGSKSISNRVLTLTALATGECRIRGMLHADDTHVMLSALQKMGLKFRWEENGRVLVVVGSGGELHPPNPPVPLFLGNAGTASRFLTTVCTVIPGTTILTGVPRLKQRPIRDLVEALRENGCDIRYLEKEGCFPLEIVVANSENRRGNGYLFGETIHLSAKLSSQYVSSILLGAPYALNPVDLRIKGETVSQPYIDMTINVMKVFGINVVDKSQGDNHAYHIPKGVYRNPAEYTIESDASSASYPLAMAAITGGTVTVNNIGRNSLQGDANFYQVLESMGCTVRQTETSTTVTGPADGVLKGIRIDMSSMTDTFMTVSVLAAVAKGTTSIYNIANQRLKESNRIAAMVTELGKCGVTARELEDGIEIEGRDRKELHGASIHCYDDHRIAMSFAVLGCVVPGVVILDKECVNKTYPEFWTDLEKYFGVKLHTPPELETSEDSKDAVPEHEKSIVIIGMRGSGKSNMGAALAKHLDWKFIDMDVAFVETVGEPIKEFVDKNGWPAFRTKEEEILRSTVSSHPRKTIISTGGGIVETESARKYLQQLYPQVIVLQISRPIADVISYLSADTSRAVLPLDTASLWERREPLYHACSKFEFFIGEGETDWKAAEKDFFHFVENNIHHPERSDIPREKDSYFLSLTNKNIKEAIPLLDKLSEGVDALELRVDLLESQDPYFVRSQIALLRRHTKLPIVFTVRADGQGGKFKLATKEETEKEMFKLLHLAVRLCCEFVDVEACWNEGVRLHLLENKLKSKVISSFHCFHEKPTEESARAFVEKCMEVGFSFQGEVRIGKKNSNKEHQTDNSNSNNSHSTKPLVDVVKVVLFAFTPDDVWLLKKVISDMGVEQLVPVIALVAGEKGKLSRVLNRYMTPVTHPLLTSAAAPGQLSVKEIEHFRAALGM